MNPFLWAKSTKISLNNFDAGLPLGLGPHGISAPKLPYGILWFHPTAMGSSYGVTLSWSSEVKIQQATRYPNGFHILYIVKQLQFPQYKYIFCYVMLCYVMLCYNIDIGLVGYLLTYLLAFIYYINTF